MKKRRILSFFLAVFVMASTVYPASAAEITNLGESGQQTEAANPSEPAGASKSEESTGTGASGTGNPSEPTGASGTENPSEPTGASKSEESTGAGASGTEEPTNPGGSTEEPTNPGNPEENTELTEDGEPAETENVKTVTVLEETEAVSAALYSASGDETDTLLAEFDFDDEGLTSSAEITTDTAKVTGRYSLTDSYTGGGKALYLNGTDQYLTVTDEEGAPLLTGLTELTVSYEAKLDNSTNGSNWIFYAAPDSNNQIFEQEKYIGLLQKGGKLTVERYQNSGSRSAAAEASVSDDWVHVDVVFSESGMTIYVGGEQKADQTSNVDISEMLRESSILQIGKANWGNGEYFKGWIDNLRIYRGALSEKAIQEQYQEYLDAIKGETESGLTLNAGYISEDLTLPSELEGASVTWGSSNSDAILIEGNTGKVTRGDSDQEVTLTATIAPSDGGSSETKTFKLVVLAKGQDIVTYVSNDPATGQQGGMKLAAEDESGYTALHKDQPVLYTTQGAKAYVSPQIFRTADGAFGMIAADGGGSGQIIVYDSKDLITYTNERTQTLPGISSIEKLACVYDMTDEVYKIFVKTAGGVCYVVTTEDFESFDGPQAADYSFAEIDGPSDAVWESKAALTQEEYDALVRKYSYPSYSSVSGPESIGDIKVEKGTDSLEVLTALEEEGAGQVRVTYKDSVGGTDTKTFDIKWNAEDLANINTDRPGTYTVTGTVGGSAYYTDADAPLIAERADPFITYNEDDGYYYFTASYPMDGSGDAEGYDRLVLRRAKTISGLADAEEVTIWDESKDPDRGRFIWAPELHKIGDSWYFISTASINSRENPFDIRPFMIKCNDPDNMMDPKSWGDAVTVALREGDSSQSLSAMALDMTYFEANGTHYLVWASYAKTNTSNLYIATIDPTNPAQLTSDCTCIAIPEYSWEQVNNLVNEGPAVFVKDGTVYLAYSASGTGSEYCVGLLTAAEIDDLTKASSWTKNPYPVLTSSDFGDEVSGPGHNSFTYDANGNLLIVYHARPTAEHSAHSGDPLFDPCRHCYVKPVFFDGDEMPVLNLSDEEFADGWSISAKVIVDGEEASDDPILEYNFDEDYQAGTAADSAGEDGANNAVLSDSAVYVQDEEYGQVLYLDGDTSVGGSDSYLAFPEGFFDGMDQLTISMDVKEVTRTGNYFTFTVGQDDQKYLFLKTMPTYMKLAVTTGSYGAEKTAEKSFTYPNNSRTWINVKIVIDNTAIRLYQDGKLVAMNSNTKIRLSDLGEDLQAYLGRSFYSADSYFRGYFDNVKVYDWAMTVKEVKEFTEKDAEARREAMEAVQRVADSFEIPNADNIKGNITLPSGKNGVSISWTSDNESVVSTKSVVNDDYDDTPAGVVTRQAGDTTVTLQAVFSKDGVSVPRSYALTVKAAPEEVSEEDYAGYLFVHFTGSESSSAEEQTYFSISEDGLNWTDLNNNQPILTSAVGESGLRDHFIGRSAEGDKFYMIATDLSIYHNRSWPEAGSNGSHSIVIWESDDLVNWSDPWMAEIAPEGAGCTWAPEFIYDEKTGEYIVYWSATTLETDADGNITQEYENHAIYYCKTRDFRTFTEAELYHKGDGVKVIDSTMIEYEGTYYRYTKNESQGIIEIDRADSVLGDYTAISSQTLSKELMNKVGAVEGPIIFKLNEKTEDGEDQWCLMVDRFARGQGYYPLITTDLSSGEFTMLEDSEFRMPSKYRHGYVMSVTQEEYAALQEAWGDQNYGNEKVLDKSTGNPMLGFDKDGDILYGGDPSILVDGDTVYCYVGNDTASGEYYQMPQWLCYSTKDMVNWTYEGVILTADSGSISWVQDAASAWAGQVIKGTDDKYYFYYCTEEKGDPGKSIGVAVSESPTGPFTDIGHPLVSDTVTQNGTVSTWEDIDPTFWQEEDENGVMHRYLGWGNTRFFVCELNEDYTSIKNRDSDENTISVGYAADGTYDIVIGTIDGNRNWADGTEHLKFKDEDGTEHYYTEAPYYYRQQDEDGNYYGPYYMFFACDWREQMAYATTDDIMRNEWTFGGIVMEPSATGNTNHMAVFDFQGSTYFVYHDGSLPHGSGFRRVACVEEFTINEDGSIGYIPKTAVGLSGTVSMITDYEGSYVSIVDFENTLNDRDYPITGKELQIDFYESGTAAEWEINPGKADPENEAYVSMESNAKPGLYMAVSGTRNADGTYNVVLSQDVYGSDDEAKSMTFRTLNGFAGDGVTFESVKYAGYYLVSRDGKLLLAQDPEALEATFYVSTDEAVKKDSQEKANREVLKTVRFYTVGETMKTDDIRIQMYLDNGTTKRITEYSTDADSVDLTTTGDKILTVTWEYQDTAYTDTVLIHVVESDYRAN